MSGLGSPEDRELNDPFGLWGDAPSYRCLVTRHRDCEPEGAEKGCTCSCGHQEPVCVCSTREVAPNGKLTHYIGCPAVDEGDPLVLHDSVAKRLTEKLARWDERRKAEQFMQDMCQPLDPEFAEKLFAEIRAEDEESDERP